MADFAPYQDVAPESSRALSPPPPKSTPSPIPRSSQQAHRSSNIGTASLASPTTHHAPSGFPAGRDSLESGGWNRREDIDLFSTRLGLRLDYEACLAYLFLPPVGGVLLLVFEHRSDYVRFHAWQSSLLFTFLFIIHIIFSWSSILSWVLFFADMGLIGWLTLRAYKDAETLDRCEVPFFGPLASSILDDE